MTVDSGLAALLGKRDVWLTEVETGMTQYLTAEERTQIEELIRSFDNHGCANGLDIKAQAALRRLLHVLHEAEQAIEKYEEAKAAQS